MRGAQRGKLPVLGAVEDQVIHHCRIPTPGAGWIVQLHTPMIGVPGAGCHRSQKTIPRDTSS